MSHQQLATVTLATLLILAAALVPIPAGALVPQARTIEVSARQFTFEPAILSVQHGDTVTLRLASLDATHGFFVDGYNIDIHVEPGRSAEITFVADKAGKFKIRCSVPCGAVHPFMTGEINVEPNYPFIRAVAMTIIVTIGALVYFRR